MIRDILKYEFLQNAVFASLFAGVICGIIGVIITEKKLLMMSGGIAHTAYGGVGLGYLLSFEPIIGAGIFAVASAFIIGAVKRKTRTNTDIIISLLWALGMALGVIFISLMKGYPPDMNAYLFGNILSVTKSDLYLMAGLSVVILAVIIIFFNDWKAFLFDSEFAGINGIKTVFLEYALLLMTALSIVVLIRAVGIILVIALLSAPAAISSFVSKRLSSRMVISSVITFVFCVIGLFVSYYVGVSSGASIVFAAALVYFVMMFIHKIRKRN